MERVVRPQQLLGNALAHIGAGVALPEAATNCGAGSIAAPFAAPTRATSSRVSPPGPQPTSSTVSPR